MEKILERYASHLAIRAEQHYADAEKAFSEEGRQANQIAALTYESALQVLTNLLEDPSVVLATEVGMVA